MTDRLSGKKVIVTAAAHGIGRASALAMAGEGAIVCASDIDGAALNELAQEDSTIEARVLDVLKPGQIEQAARDLGPVDVLFNCSGYVHHGTILQCDEAAWDFSFDLNLKAHYRMIRAFLPAMLDNGGGSIINMASAVSAIKGAPDRFCYGATKAGVMGMTRQIAADFVGQNIRCNAICPGTVDTPSLRKRIDSLGEKLGGFDSARDYFMSRQPAGRFASAEEIASVAVFLASDEASFVTGQSIVVDGGWTL